MNGDPPRPHWDLSKRSVVERGEDLEWRLLKLEAYARTLEARLAKLEARAEHK